jgi:hypothetical protein
MNRSAIVRLAAVTALLVALLLSTGCSLLGIGGPEDQTVTDAANYYHFKIPGDWQADTSQGFVVVYASEELPMADEPFDKLTLFAFSSAVVGEDSEGEELESIVERRATNRGWGEYETGEAVDIELGGRPGSKVRVTGTDGEDREFEADFYLVRTGGKSIGLMAVAPPGELDGYADDVALITGENWFWHFSDPEASGEETATDEPSEGEDVKPDKPAEGEDAENDGETEDE